MYQRQIEGKRYNYSLAEQNHPDFRYMVNVHPKTTEPLIFPVRFQAFGSLTEAHDWIIQIEQIGSF